MISLCYTSPSYRTSVTPVSKLKLINYILILCLRLEDWSMNTAEIQDDLNMPMDAYVQCLSMSLT